MRPVRRASVREAKIAAQPVVGQVAGRKAHWNRGTGPFSLSLSLFEFGTRVRLESQVRIFAKL